MDRTVSANRLVSNKMYDIMRSSGRIEARGLYTGRQQTSALAGPAPIFLVDGVETAFGPWRYTYKVYQPPMVAPAAGGRRTRRNRKGRRATRRKHT